MSTTDAAALLADYVAIPSVNPMDRRDVDPAIVGEGRYAEHVGQGLRRLGADVELIGRSERQSVVAEFRVTGAVDSVLIASHLDTVPVDGMTIDPFDPQIRGERLYGRGSCDTKAGMAAIVAALAHVLRRGRLRRNVLVVGESDEEMGSLGVRDVVAHLGEGKRRADWALATEPTDLRLVTHHKGRVSARLEVRGRACHSSHPDHGDNAIVSLSRLVVALDALHREMAAAPDAMLGPATLSVGLVGGGQAPNIVADRAWVVVDYRTLPGDTPETVRGELERAAAAAGVLDRVEVAECRLDKEPLATEHGTACVGACRASMLRSGLCDAPLGVAFATDAGPLSLAGLPSVVMGPGSIAQAHTADEYVPLSQLETMRDFFVDLLSGGALPLK